jgi:DNA-binding beta-propeller fold protein YncE
VTTYTANGTPTTPTITVNGVLEGMAVDAAGKIYIAYLQDVYFCCGTLTTYTANGTPTTPTITDLIFPHGVAVDAAGKIYVASSGDQYRPGNVTTYTANGTPTTPTIDVPYPWGVAVDAARTVRHVV